MALTQTGEGSRGRQLRLWPGVVAVVLQWLVRFGLPIVMPEAVAYAVISGFIGGLAVLVWWVFLSRVPRSERWGAVELMIAALAATPRILHKSIATGMMGMMFRRLRRSGTQPRVGRLGVGQPPPLRCTSTRDPGRGHPGCLRGLGAAAHRG